MEQGAHVWLRSRDDGDLQNAGGGWIPALIKYKTEHKNDAVFTLTQDEHCGIQYFDGLEPFEVTVTVDAGKLKASGEEACDEIKLRNVDHEESRQSLVTLSPSARASPDFSKVQHSAGAAQSDDLIHLSHLNEPAILHALRLRYDDGIIYTATGPILIAINPFKNMKHLYNEDMINMYRLRGEGFDLPRGMTNNKNYLENGTETKQPQDSSQKDLQPHAYQTADNAYRAMMRGLENKALAANSPKVRHKRVGTKKEEPADIENVPNQSILVSGESGAGKTVTTKIVLNYFAVLSRKKVMQSIQNRSQRNFSSPSKMSPSKVDTTRMKKLLTASYLSTYSLNTDEAKSPDGSFEDEEAPVESQVLEANPVLEAFGNARTFRNDNSSRFGKYIDVRFSRSGKLIGASIETYLLEKVRLVHVSPGERNYHIFYQFLSGATQKERKDNLLKNMTVSDFNLLSQSGTYGRRDGVLDRDNHIEMLDAMDIIGFDPTVTKSILRLISGILFAGNMKLEGQKGSDLCAVVDNYDSRSAASLLGVSFDGLIGVLTSKTISAGFEQVEVNLNINQALKAREALIKAVYGALFDYIVQVINRNIFHEGNQSSASIGVLDIFGFESFEYNNFEQLCINYTNETLQQQFNRHVFKTEQNEYEREGILWKFIPFPDNQDVLDLIDKKHTGILSLLDEQCIVPQSTDEKLCRYLYQKCDKHPRFQVSPSQKPKFKFSIEHYAGPVEYSTDTWLEKNKDELPMAAANLILSSDFDFIDLIKGFLRKESSRKQARGSIVSKSVGAQFSSQLKVLRSRIEKTAPHYIRCLKPNDDLLPDDFEPQNIVEQLRCGGVLEAVRVSRAGYPTRYTHDVFLARYFILRKTVQYNANFDELRTLVDDITFDFWNEDRKLIESLERGEKFSKHNGVPKKTSKSLWSKKSSSRRSSADEVRERLSIGVDRPETEAEFRKLDFQSRCAVAGMQVGRTKIFLRREAFDRIEALRSKKFFRSASIIQAKVRSILARRYFLILKAATIVIQKCIRGLIARRNFNAVRTNHAAYIIQVFWKACRARASIYSVYKKLMKKIVTIQRAWRKSYYSRKMAASMQTYAFSAVKIQSAWRQYRTRILYQSTLYGIIKCQALARRVIVAKQMSLVKEASLLAEKRRTRKAESTPFALDPHIEEKKNLLYSYIQDENWSMVEQILDKYPHLATQTEPSSDELPLHIMARHSNTWTLLIDMLIVLHPKALIHRDRLGALPIHHAAAHDNIAALEIIYNAYKDGVNDVDSRGRLPVHVAAEFDAIDAIKFLLEKNPEGSYTMIYKPPLQSGGGLPLHVACRFGASVGVISALLSDNFSAAKRVDENNDLPLHLILRCGEEVEPVLVKTLLSCFSSAVSRPDVNGDLPLSIALKHSCKPAVVNMILLQFPSAAQVLNAAGHSPLFLALLHDADDKTILSLINHAPEFVSAMDAKTGLTPIQIATENEHSNFVVFNLLKRDMPIDMKEKVQAQLLPHNFSWNHILSNTNDNYHQVITKMLQQCTQPQVLALAHVEGPEGKIALATATPICKHEIRVMLRLFNTLEIVNQRPAYTNPASDTQIFYALRYEPPLQLSPNTFTILHEDEGDDKMDDSFEDMDDNSLSSRLSATSLRSCQSARSQLSIETKRKQISKERGQQVIAKLTSKSDVVERELKVRKEYELSRNYVPTIISVHHTVQHAAYSEAMAEPGFCITMEGADNTAENFILDMKKSGQPFPIKALKRIGVALLHMHERGLVHGDFGSHNIGKFGNRWKLLGIGGSVPIGQKTSPRRGFYHPPESIQVEMKSSLMGKKSTGAVVVSIKAAPTYDIWAYGAVVYEALAGCPLPLYSCRGRRAMNAAEFSKIAKWDDDRLKKLLKSVGTGFSINDAKMARDLLYSILQANPSRRVQSVRDILEHPFFTSNSQ